MTGVGKTDVGKIRKCNEDTVFVCNTNIGPLPDLYIVADGMGGHRSGDVASRNAVDYFCGFVAALEGECEILDALIDSAKYANRKVYQLSLEKDEYTNMGTTFLAAVICEGKVYIAHVGDCRLYIIRDGSIRQVTSDHTYVMELVKSGMISREEAAVHPERNIITRALGVDDDVYIDGLFQNLLPEDIVIICSDGLYEMIDDDKILEIVSDKNLNLECKADKLIDAANLGGGKDNISVVLIG